MKKIICMLAMALLAIGAAQAQNQVRKMVVRQNDGQEMRFKTADIEEVTFETVAVPTTVEEAEAMLVGYWKMSVNPQDFEYPVDIEGVYWVITEDLKVYLVLKFAESVTFEEYVEYAGKYVAESYPGDVIVNSEDPTTGELFGLFFNNLDQNSFDVHLDDDGIKLDFTIYRVEPFEYIMPSDGLMKK